MESPIPDDPPVTSTMFWFMAKKSGQATHVAPLQPHTLAPFPAWGSSAGAGRMRLARRKGNKQNCFPKNS